MAYDLAGKFMDGVRGVADSLVNVLGGFGVPGRDKAAGAGSFFVYDPLDRNALDSAYRGNWIARKLVDIPAQDATRAWRAWQADTNVIEKLEEEEQRLGLQGILLQGLTMARLYGGSALILGVAGSDNSKPLEFERVKKGGLKFVMPVTRWQLGQGPLNRDATEPDFGKPQYFTQADGGRIHPSRVILLQGLRHPDPLQANDIWGDSVLQNALDAVKAATLVTSAIATLVTEAKIDVIKIPDLSENIASAEYQNRLTARFIYANTAKSIINTLVLDKEEDWDRKVADFAQLPQLLQMYLLVASGAADIPATRMLGQSPAGLNSTGDGDLRNYYDHVNSNQTNVLSPALAGLDDVFIRSALGSRDPSLYYIWNPLWQLSPEVKSAVAKQKADAANLDSMMGLIDPEALRIGRQNQLIEDGTYPGLEQALEQQDQLDMESMQSVEEQEAQAEAEQRKQLMMGGAAGNQMPGQQGPQKGGQQKKPFGGGDARPLPAARRIKLGGRRKLTRDFNPYHDPDDGRFTTGGGEGGGSGGGDDPYQLKGRPASSMSAASEHAVYRPSDAPKARVLKAQRNKIVAAIDRYKNYPESKRVTNLMGELRNVMKETRRLRLDPGGLAGFGQPGGHDVVIIGGGPAGLMAAVNTAYEGMTTMLIEAKPQVGGQAEPSSGIKNALGTGPYGKTGRALFSEMGKLAELNGAEVRTGTKAIAISYNPDTGEKTVHLDTGEKVTARNVILAAGVQFITTKFEGSDGEGVYWGDGSGMTSFAGKGGTAVVVGGSNGAAQAAIGAANSGTKVVLLARSGLDKMSEEARTPLENNPNVKIVTGTEIERLERDANGKPQTVVTKDGQRFKAESVGLFLGQAPSTKWLPEEIAVDQRGFVKTDIDYKTTMPGVFAPGDIRSGGPQRVLRSGGEGQSTQVEIYKYFLAQKEAAARGDPAPHASAWVRHVSVPEAEQQALLAKASEAEQLRAELAETQRQLAAALGRKPAGDADLPVDVPGKMTMSQWDRVVDLMHEIDLAFPYILQCDDDDGDHDELQRAAGLRDFNEEHKGSGPGGGQFAPKGGGGVGGVGGSTATSGGGKDPSLGEGEGGANEPQAKKTDITQNMSADYDAAARQPAADVEQLYALSRKAEPAFQKTVEEFATKFGGKVIYQPAESAEPGTRMKNRVSAERKVKGEYKGDATQIRDVLRATVAFDDVVTTREAVADFVASNDVTRVKDRFVSPMGGYRDLMLNFRLPNGLITEVQFSTPSLLEAKNGEGHKLYKATQSLTTKSIHTAADDAIIAENIAKSEQLYTEAYEADGDGCGWLKDC